MKQDEILERLQAEVDHAAEGFAHYYREQNLQAMAANGVRQNAFEEAIRIVEGDESAGTAAQRVDDVPSE